MDDLHHQYHYWIEKLGWVTPEMLCLLTRSVSRSQLPGGRDHRLERFLAGAVRSGQVLMRYVEGQRVYGSSARVSNRSTNAYHDVMAAQALVKLWLAFPSSKLLFTPGDFFARQCTVIPDFAMTVTTTHGVHGFALEYQTYREASRTTQAKIGDYWQNFEEVRQMLDADFLWVIFVVEREPEWMAELTKTLAHSFIYLIDALIFLHTEDIATTPIFWSASGKQVSLVGNHEP